MTPYISDDEKTCAARDVPKYEALSYVWGKEDLVDTAYISPSSDQAAAEAKDTTQLPLTENLSLALHRLRHPSRPRTMWIDALCINQHDTHERNTQVRHMNTIYTLAHPRRLVRRPLRKQHPRPPGIDLL